MDRLFRSFSRETTYFRFLVPLALVPRTILESNFRMISMLVNSEFTLNTDIKDDYIEFSFDI